MRAIATCAEEVDGLFIPVRAKRPLAGAAASRYGTMTPSPH
jgi:hypothetical protein